MISITREYHTKKTLCYPFCIVHFVLTVSVSKSLLNYEASKKKNRRKLIRRVKMSKNYSRTIRFGSNRLNMRNLGVIFFNVCLDGVPVVFGGFGIV